MRICLAGINGCSNYHEHINPRFMLESFPYFKEWELKYLKTCEFFMLDSGAFSFRKQAKGDIDWNNYVERYADFVKNNHIKYFFEVDIDNVIGYDNVKKFRKKLETLTGSPCIPVWHPNRGKDDFIQMCKEYDYVSLGGIVGVDNKRKNQYLKLFPYFIETAHKYNARIHGLGYTHSDLSELYFDSVDSTSWLSGGRFGTLYYFNGTRLDKIAFKNRRIKDYISANIHNFNEWQKYCDYMHQRKGKF